MSGSRQCRYCGTAYTTCVDGKACCKACLHADGHEPVPSCGARPDHLWQITGGEGWRCLYCSQITDDVDLVRSGRRVTDAGRKPTAHGGCATGLGCGSVNVNLVWAAMDTSDTNSWECLDCGRRWRTPYYSLADAKQDEWQAAALAAGWTPPVTPPARETAPGRSR